MDSAAKPSINKRSWKTLLYIFIGAIAFIIFINPIIQSIFIFKGKSITSGGLFVLIDIISFAIIVGVIFLIIWFYNQKSKFWSEYAQEKGWKYEPERYIENSNSLPLGFSKRIRTFNVLSGNLSGCPITIFGFYSPPTGAFSLFLEKGQQYYIVMVAEFSGNFPHLFLDRKLVYGYKMRFGKSLKLSREMDKKYALYAPPEYEIEALEIFTPEILAKILDLRIQHDIELLDNKMYVFIYGSITNREKLENRLKLLSDLIALFKNRLNNYKFQPIPRKSSRLTS